MTKNETTLRTVAAMPGIFGTELCAELLSMANQEASKQDSTHSLSAAMAVVTGALRENPEYVWGWHCSLTMSAQDAGCPRQVADEASARFLQLLADVDVRKHKHFPPKLTPAVTKHDPFMLFGIKERISCRGVVGIAGVAK